MVLGASLLLGVGSVFSIPATLSVVPELVDESDLSVAITLNTMGINLARMVGPVVGALVLAGAGAGRAFAVNALSFLVFALVCRRLPTASRTETTDDPTAPTEDRRYRAALTLVWRDRTLRLLMLCVVVVGVLLEPNTTLAAPLADSVGAGESFVGTIVGAFGAGALLSGSLVRRTTVGGMPTASAGFLAAAVGLTAVSLATAPQVVLVGFALLGAGYLATISLLTTQIQLSAPQAVRGRVMALWSQLLLGVCPVSSLVLGGLTDLLWVQVATWSLVALCGVGWWLSARAHRPAGAGHHR